MKRPSVIALLGLAWVACSGEPTDNPRFPTEERYVSKLTPKGRQGRSWFPESKLPARPQTTPWMVIYEVSRFPGARASDAQQRAARELHERSRAAAERHGWFDYLKGRADGFQPAIGDETHYENVEYIGDDAFLDPDRPEFLMYYETPRGRKLAGFMYYVRQPKDEGPQIGGPLTIWHYHVWARAHCLRDGLVAAGVADREGRCRSGVPSHRSPEMLHVWFVDHPQGPFATAMKLPANVLAELADAGAP